MSTSFLTIDSLVFNYGTDQKKVLDAVSFDIQAHTITAILGPNGAGKTTLIHLMLGLRKPVSGTINLNGLPLAHYSRRELSQWMGLVPQSEYIPFDHSVLEFVLLGRAPYLGPLDLPKELDIGIARQALSQVGLSDLEKRPIPSLSGGELQLVLIARALAQQPRILLLDEPTSHLDLSNRNVTLRILNQLRKNGSTVLFTTHDPDAASLIADNLVLMRHGRVLYADDIESTFTGQKLSETYGTQIEVLQIKGQRIVHSLELING